MLLPRPLSSAMRQRYLAQLCMVSAFLALVPVSATHAEWLLVEPNNSTPDPFVVFIDSESITHKRDRMTVRVLLNMRHRTDDGIASVIAVDEYDCRAERMRTRSMVSYAETDGKGAVVREFKTVGEWVKIEAGKINEAVMDSACPEY